MADRYYAYCTYGGDVGRTARGFVLAPNLKEAMAKARKRVAVERRRVAKYLGMRVQDLPNPGRTYRVQVWLDKDRSTAPAAARHYTEKARTA